MVMVPHVGAVEYSQIKNEFCNKINNVRKVDDTSKISNLMTNLFFKLKSHPPASDFSNKIRLLISFLIFWITIPLSFPGFIWLLFSLIVVPIIILFWIFEGKPTGLIQFGGIGFILSSPFWINLIVFLGEGELSWIKAIDIYSDFLSRLFSSTSQNTISDNLCVTVG